MLRSAMLYLIFSEPDFIYSFEYGDHVYFILKEIAVEVMNTEVRCLCSNAVLYNIMYSV